MHRRPLAFAVLCAVVAFVAATALDSWAYRHLEFPGIYERDWGRLLRIAGFLPTWALVSVALALGAPQVISAPRERLRPYLPLIAAALGGLAAELLKLLLRRERPSAHDGEYFFRAWSERTFSTGGLALPSGHTLVAFAAAAMLARMYPRARWVFYGFAAGCAFSRVLARAHFLSDVTLAAIVGWFVVAGIWRFVVVSEPQDLQTP